MLRNVLALACAIVVAALALLPTAGGGGAEAGAVDPEQVVENFWAAAEDADVGAISDVLAEDAVLTDIDGGSFAVVGRSAFELVLTDFEPGDIELVSIDDVEGNTVSGVFTDSSAGTIEGVEGVDRVRQFFEMTVGDDGLITRLDFTYDEDDAQTADYLAAPDEDDDEGPPPGAVTVPLSAQPGGNQPGQAIIASFEGVTGVELDVTAGPAGVQQPAHFHTGTCAAPGPIVEPLASVLDGASFTILSAPMSDLVDKGLIINVHKSTTEVTSYVSCGVVLSAAAAPTPGAGATATAPAATPTRPTGVTAPDTGTGDGAGGSGAPAWIYAVLAAGAAALGAGSLGLRKR